MAQICSLLPNSRWLALACLPALASFFGCSSVNHAVGNGQDAACSSGIGTSISPNLPADAGGGSSACPEITQSSLRLWLPDSASSSTDCTAPLLPGDDRICMIGNRTYLLYAPPNYNPCEPAALVVDAHGALETAAQQAGNDSIFCALGACWPGKGSGFRLEAAMPGGGFIVATPQGINNMWTPANNDPQLMLDIVDHVKTIAKIDPKKIYMSGISNGAGITYQTGCPNTAVFSALAPHSGGANCTSIDHPISLIAFDAMADFAYQSSLSARDTMVKLNHCANGPHDWLSIDSNTTDAVCRDEPYSTDPKIVPCSSISPPIQPTVCQMWDQCDDGVEVVFCEVSPGTIHADRNNPSINDAHIIYGNASHLNTPSIAWRFFKRHW
jgi:poly(3-hydroxybutyrate) depolymerase